MKSAEIAALLPAVFRETATAGTPLAALLEIMEALHAPSEEVLASLDRYLDPRRTPDAFVPLLASWLDLSRFVAGPSRRTDGIVWPIPVGQLREWVASAAHLARMRGTPEGLRRLLEVATGTAGFTILEGIDRRGRPRPFHLRVIAPPEAERYKTLIESIVSLEKPAYMTADAVEFSTAEDGQPV